MVTGHRGSGFGRNPSAVPDHTESGHPQKKWLKIIKKVKFLKQAFIGAHGGKLDLHSNQIWPWTKFLMCPMSHEPWPQLQFQPACHRSHPRPNWLKWYSILCLVLPHLKLVFLLLSAINYVKLPKYLSN